MRLVLSKKKIFVLVVFIAVLSIVIFIIAGIKTAGKTVSYLPDNIPSFIDSMPSRRYAIEIKNNWFTVGIGDKGKIAVTGKDGKLIISGLSYYGELKDGNNLWGLRNVTVKKINDSTAEIKGTGINNDQLDLLLIANNSLQKIDFKILTKYYKNSLINRESFVVPFALPVSEVYLKNSEVDSKNFASEYWLLKQGVFFSDQRNSALVYHNPEISSLQLETSKKLLFINLDYSLDHPFVNLPYQADAGRRWVNLSYSDYKSDNRRENSFSIYINPVQKEIPRLMLVPFGYKAGYVFTEHADGGQIKTQRAAYFGSEEISESKNANGGFVYYKIPVTKSVFYTGTVTNSGESIYEGGQITAFADFLDQLNKMGIYDLCLHTPEDSTSNRKNLEDAISYMKAKYNTISWIDHGFYGGRINRESMVCDGLDSLSPYYAADLWKKYDTKYFWSAAVEMIKNKNWVSVADNLKRFKFFTAYVAFLRRYASPDDLKNANPVQLVKNIRKNFSYRFEENTLEFNSGDAQPTPLFWKNPSRTEDFYNWATDQEKNYGDISDKIVQNEYEQLDNLIDHQGVFINHGYFVRNRFDDKNLIEVNGKLVTNPNFNKILARISEKRSKGDLYVTTIRDLLDYWIKLEKVKFEYLPDGSINIINNNDQPINGLSMIIKSKNVLVDGKIPASKPTGDDTIFWFDMVPHQTIKLTYN
jgi:hypothetical protein